MNPKSLRAEIAFRERIKNLGGICVYETWLGNGKPHHVICNRGHDTFPQPNTVQQRNVIPCVKCRKDNPIKREARFFNILDYHGAICLSPNWMGDDIPHHVKCANGHLCYVIPRKIRNYRLFCPYCARNNTELAEQNFRNRISELGGTCLFEQWRGVNKPHHVKCVNGHDCYPRPNHTLEGIGICKSCAWDSQDHFYLVYNPHTDIYKFGITSNDPIPRLDIHRRNNFTEVVKLYHITSAIELEQYVLTEFAKQGYKPVYGKEYFREPEDWRPIYAWLDTEVEKRGGIPIPI